MLITSKVVNWLPKSPRLAIHFESFEQTSLQLKECFLGKKYNITVKGKPTFFNSVFWHVILLFFCFGHFFEQNENWFKQNEISQRACEFER